MADEKGDLVMKNGGLLLFPGDAKKNAKIFMFFYDCKKEIYVFDALVQGECRPLHYGTRVG